MDGLISGYGSYMNSGSINFTNLLKVINNMINRSATG